MRSLRGHSAAASQADVPAAKTHTVEACCNGASPTATVDEREVVLEEEGDARSEATVDRAPHWWTY
jgi:hypothetical protein